jgi:ADP-ribose pyrophosphatase
VTGEPEVLGAGRHLRLVRREGWEYAERVTGTGVVAVVAVTDDDRVVLTEQYRPPVRSPVIELPAGLVGDLPGALAEDLVTAARRELEEETGYAASALRLLGAGPSSAGLAAEVVSFLLATGLVRVGPGGGDATEAITVHEVPLAAVDAWLAGMVGQGRLVDPKVYAGLWLAGRSGRP